MIETTKSDDIILMRRHQWSTKNLSHDFRMLTFFFFLSFDKTYIKNTQSVTRTGLSNMPWHKQKSINKLSLTFFPSWPCNKDNRNYFKCFGKIFFYKEEYQNNVQEVQGSLFAHVGHEDQCPPAKISQLINNLLPAKTNKKRKVKYNPPAFLYDLFDLSAPANPDFPKIKQMQYTNWNYAFFFFTF